MDASAWTRAPSEVNAMAGAASWAAAGFVIGSAISVVLSMLDRSQGYAPRLPGNTVGLLVTAAGLAAYMPWQIKSGAKKRVAAYSADETRQMEALEAVYQSPTGPQLLRMKRRLWGMLWFVWPCTALLTVRAMYQAWLTGAAGSPATVVGGLAMGAAIILVASLLAHRIKSHIRRSWPLPES